MKWLEVFLDLVVATALAQDAAGIPTTAPKPVPEFSCRDGGCTVTGRTSAVISAAPRRSYTFEPKDDITAPELALALKAILPNVVDKRRDHLDLIDALPPGAKRHFVEHPAR